MASFLKGGLRSTTTEEKQEQPEWQTLEDQMWSSDVEMSLQWSWSLQLCKCIQVKYVLANSSSSTVGEETKSWNNILKQPTYKIKDEIRWKMWSGLLMNWKMCIKVWKVWKKRSVKDNSDSDMESWGGGGCSLPFIYGLKWQTMTLQLGPNVNGFHRVCSEVKQWHNLEYMCTCGCTRDISVKVKSSKFSKKDELERKLE